MHQNQRYNQKRTGIFQLHFSVLGGAHQRVGNICQIEPADENT